MSDDELYNTALGHLIFEESSTEVDEGQAKRLAGLLALTMKKEHDKFEKLILKYAVEVILLTEKRKSLMPHEVKGIYLAAWNLLKEAGITKNPGTAWTLPEKVLEVQPEDGMG
jgi:hypothetical protein